MPALIQPPSNRAKHRENENDKMNIHRSSSAVPSESSMDLMDPGAENQRDGTDKLILSGDLPINM